MHDLNSPPSLALILTQARALGGAAGVQFCDYGLLLVVAAGMAAKNGDTEKEKILTELVAAQIAMLQGFVRVMDKLHALIPAQPEADPSPF